ncbi:LOW QUALITY PROTEIN: nuclear pore complex protein NUP155 [Dioscorea cayenensis subsp. rotundata]|uniref:LOW QUALITY PROTEIN: nuclear pore complex protein NUP155 n=1 Tax=Dioscorea cayennensis subsp. rotundata TaxID=55577 RepID=A0AB40BKJ7_DIOCR|nr:LOW QUALITY PROTEIN: nuclear pore complex protein NUP155 [Dioscorea cayenensis subsp. rotundata]
MAWENDTVGPDVAIAGVHISERIGKDVAGQLDLEEALEASRYASHPFSSHPKEWPPLFEVVENRELPPVLIERFNAAGGEGTALCGIFPEIRRAWASVDNALFLWRFDKWDGQCPEYNGEEQAICAVGLVRSKPGIFVEAIQYLIVLATPVELVLVGVCCTARGDGTDPYDELSLQPLPEYTIPSDGVTMTSIACTDRGQIFLAGRDGHIYEMQYTTGSGWHKRCRKVCLTAGLGSLISRWVLPNAFKFGAVDPIVDMVIDNERHILYARTEDMKLQAFDLGVDGDGPFKKIAEEKNLIDPRETQYGGRRSAASRALARAAKPSIVYIAPLSTMESKWLHVVTVLSDGRRLYLSTSSSSGSNRSVGGLTGLDNNYQRPCCLKVVATRPSPPLGVGGGLTFGAMSVASRSQPEDLALKVETAFYSLGSLVLSDSSSPAVSSLLIVGKDSSMQSSAVSNFGVSLRELVSSLPVDGRMLVVADVLPTPDIAITVQSLYADVEVYGFAALRESCEKASAKLWARGDLQTQHILPRRRIVVFTTMGIMEVVSNRPVDTLRRLFESNAPRSHIEDFFNRFGAGEAAAMCLLLAAKLAYSEENLVSNAVAEKAAEVFEDPRMVGMPQLDGAAALPNTRSPPGGFSMGQVVQEAEPVFSGAHEGLCLCSSRLLLPIWELPVMIVRREMVSDTRDDEGVVVCRLSTGAMQVLENKIRSLEQFLRSRRNQSRGLYGYVAGLGDFSGSILYGTSSDLGTGGMGSGRNLFGPYSRTVDSGDGMTANKRSRLPYNPAELAAMEVRAMECLRRLLRRSSEALFLLQLISQHHVTRLVQGLDSTLRQRLLQLTFHQLVCSEEGDQLAMQLISSLMQYHIGQDGRGTVDEISVKLRDGCPSFYNESDYKYFLAVECLERAVATKDAGEREILARDAYNFLSKIPDSADLSSVCKRFADLRFYEAVVRLPLRKAQALDPNGDAVNDKIDPVKRNDALAQREQCYEIVVDALRSLKGEVAQKGMQEFGASAKFSGSGSVLDQTSRNKFIRQIIQLGVQWPDTLFHEHMYRALIELGLDQELLEYGGSDLVSFLQSAGRRTPQEIRAATVTSSMGSPLHAPEAPIPPSQTKYLDLLARYYVLKRQHLLAANVLYRLAERQCSDAGEGPTLEQRRQYLSNAVLQAKSASTTAGTTTTRQNIDDGLLDMLEGKLTVLKFQMKIKEELDSIASSLDDVQNITESLQNNSFPHSNLMADASFAIAAREKAKELSLELKSITQLYNEYAVPFRLWEICLEMLNFANYSGDADSKIVRETWARLLDQALSKGGVAEACSVLKRVGSNLYPGDGACLPLDTLCLHLEKAALEHLSSGVELVGDEDVARALLASCRGAPEPVLSIYDQLLSNGVILPSPILRLRLLRSVLVVLREWAMSIFANRMDTTTAGASFIFGGRLSLEQTTMVNQGVRDKITSALNRYMTEVRRLALPQSQTEPVYRGFRDLEEKLLAPSSLPTF